MMTALSGCGLWIGGVATDELALARDWAAETLAAHGARLDAVASPAAVTADGGTPCIALLASDTPARWTTADAVMLSRVWPLMPIVSVAASLVEGRRRSGPHVAGIEEVAWHDLPGRLECWLSGWEAGGAGTLGVPATTRRDERVLAVARQAVGVPTTPVAIVATTPTDTEGLADLVAAAGGSVAATGCGRPSLDTAAPLLVWEVGRLAAEHMQWLRLLAANRPQLATVLVAPFLRGDSARAAIDAGAAAVLGRPLSVEALAGTLRRVARPRDGLGGPPVGR
jgi:hypothetical protein